MSRRAVVTGASAGIGAAFATELAVAGHPLVLVARRRDRLEALAEGLRARHGVAVDVVAADLTKDADLHALEERLAADSELGILINNAGFGTIGPFVSLPADVEQEEIALNVIAMVRLTRAALPGMLARRDGWIINLSSLAAFQVGVQYATYAATKSFVNAFTEALSEETRGSGVRLQALCPGFTHTEFQARAGLDSSRIPAIAWMTAEQVARLSLGAVRRGVVICVPGVRNRFTASLLGWLPRAAVRSVSRRLASHYLR